MSERFQRPSYVKSSYQQDNAKSMSKEQRITDSFIAAVDAGDYVKVEDYLVTLGQDVSAVDSFKDSALLVAVRRGDTSMVSLLLDNNADINWSDADGWTALHESAFAGNVEVVTLLLGYGANQDLKTIDGRKPLDLAVRYGHMDVVEILSIAFDREKGFV